MDDLDMIREAQTTDSAKRFRDNFAIDDAIGGSNSYLLTSDGCFQRHTLKRKAMYLTDKENKLRNFEHRNYSEREESKIQNTLFSLFQSGHKLRPDESAEDFINRCQQEVEDGIL